MSLTQTAVKVVAIDDDMVVRIMIERFLSHNDLINFLGAYHDIDQLLNGLGPSAPDVILLDWNLAGARVYGVAGIHLLKQRYPSARIIVFSGVTDENTAIQALSTGADGFLLKNTPANHLVNAVGSVSTGENPLSPAITSKVINFIRSLDATSMLPQSRHLMPMAEENTTQPLTSRERNVMELICKGESTKKIADAMGVTIHTIRFHLRNIYEKLNAHTQTEAVLTYLRRN